MPIYDHFEKQLVEFLDTWTDKKIGGLLSEAEYLLDLHHNNKENDWLEETVGIDNVMNVRLIRTVYILSRMCSRFGGLMVLTNGRHKDLWLKIERELEKAPNHEQLESSCG